MSQYSGEHLIPGVLGNAFVALTFAAAALSVFAYAMAFFQKGESSLHWKKLGRKSFFVSSIASFIFIGIMFYLLTMQYFEYHYVWEQINSKMSFKYILVAFWGGQSGSFMLWIFWHAVIGLFLLKKERHWETEVMGIFALVMMFLSSMLLGIYIGDYRLGSNPFGLQRDVVDGFGTIWSLIPDYLQLDPRFENGKGLNPLLQNYWMIIHPPTLFLGFALTLVPFAYAAAGLLRKSYQDWIKPALPWTFVGILVLGVGILMGGAWAYESLSFGGFWAWDPVENASLVPWLTLVGAGHLMLVNKNHQRSLYSAFFFSLISFILILYSTFLTRSGVLGDTSVHSFTGDGMLGQLLAYLVFFIWFSFMLLLVDKKARIRFTLISIVLTITGFMVDLNAILTQSGDFILTWRGLILLIAFTFTTVFLINNYLLHFPREKKEEELWSREFWMFIGSLVLILSGLQITFSTSIPVINLLFDTKMQLVEQAARNEEFNRWQTPFAIIIAILVAFTQFLKYKNTDFTEFIKKIAVSLGISLVLTFVLGFIFQFSHYRYLILLLASLFTVIANFDYWIRFLKGKLNHAGPSIAHIGFGILLLGALISQNKQQVISETTFGYNLSMLGKEMSNNSDVQIFRGDTTEMKEYFVSYSDKVLDGHFLRFNIDYFGKEAAQYKIGDRMKFEDNVYTCKTEHTSQNNFQAELKNWEMISDATVDDYFKAKPWSAFQPSEKLYTLQPFVQLNDMSNVAEPGTKHFFDHDVFTHIKYADLNPGNQSAEMPPYELKGKEGDTIGNPGFIVRILSIEGIKQKDNTSFGLDSSDLGAVVHLMINDIWDVNLKYGIPVDPVFVVKNNMEFTSKPVFVSQINTTFNVKNIAPKKSEEAHVHEPGDTTHVHEAEPMNSDRTKVKNGFMMGESEITIEVTTPEFIVMHAIRFPWIMILWLGCIIMALGTGMAVYHRVKRA